MKVTWIGQAGLLFEGTQLKVLVDPYLSDACGEKNPKSHRRIPVDPTFLDCKPDVIVLTHDHLDHTDEQTLAHYLKEDSGTLVLASPGAWEHVRSFGGNNNYVRFARGVEWTHPSGVRFSAVGAEHSDPFAIGVLITEGETTYYVTGDTLYSRAIAKELPDRIDTVFLPINGKGNNMNATDAARFADRIGARHAVPLHYGMFDGLDPRTFCAKNRVIAEVYRPIPLD